MGFQDNLAAMPAIDHLSGLDILDKEGNVVHHIPNALAQEFGGKLDAAAAERGLAWFAEHVADAEANPGKHPNIDLLFKVKAENASLTLKPLAA